MMLFDIFDQLGNKIGEVHEADNSLDGGGLCCIATHYAHNGRIYYLWLANVFQTAF